MVDQIVFPQGYSPIPQTAVPVSNAASGQFSVMVKDAVQMKSGTSGSMDAIFERASAEYGVPLNLLKAVAKTESAFDSNAVSSCGAQGVMQLMPATARSLGVDNPFNAEQNIRGGAKYLSQLMERYDGDWKLTLAAYNAGAGNVAKYGGVPPFKETQNYVQKVMRLAGEQVTVPNTPVQVASPGLPAALGQAGNPSSSGIFSALPLSAVQTGQQASQNSGLDFTSLMNYTSEDYALFLRVMMEEARGQALDLTGRRLRIGDIPE